MPCQGITDSKQLFLLCIEIVERKICSSKCDGSRWSYQQRKKKVHGFLPSGSKYVREPPNFLVPKSFLFESESRAAALQASKVLWNIHEALTDDPDIFFYREGKDQCCSQIPNPAALVYPKTCDTVAENACNIASHLSIDRTHDKWGIFRQARYIQAVLNQTCQKIPQVVQVWSEKSFVSLVHEFFGCKQHGTATYRLQVYMGKSCLNLHHKLHLHKQVLWNINVSMVPPRRRWSVPKHVTLWHKTLVILPATFPIDRTHDKGGILRLSWSRRVRESPRVAQVWSEKSFLSLVQEFFGCKQHGTATSRMQVWMGKSCLKLDHKLHRHKQALGNIHELPWLMIPIPAALVCPKTCNTMMAEDTCNIASHLSIDRTHDKRGILRQSWSRHVRESPQLFKCEVRSHSFLLSKSFLDAITATCRLQVYMGKVWFKPFKPFTSKYCGTFMNHPGSWFLPQQHSSVPRHMTLWQKMLATLPATFPLTALTIREEYSGRRGIFRQSWSRHVRESPKLLKCEVRSPSSLLSKSFLVASSMAQPRTGCKYIWESLVWICIISCTFTSKYCGTLMNHPGLWFLTSSIGLSQDRWHCGTRCL